MIDRRWYSSILNVRSFGGADCDTDHYLVVAKVKESLAVSKLASQKFDGDRFNLRELNELEVKKQYQIEITSRFAALENLRDGEDINRAGRTLNRITKHQLKRVRVCKNWNSINHDLIKNVWFLDQRRQAKIQWVQDPNQNNVDNLYNVRRGASRNFRKIEGISES